VVDEAPVSGEERLLTGYSGRISSVLAIGWLGALLGRQVLSPLLPEIIVSLDITPTEAGMALTLMMGLYAISQYPSGHLSDNLSRTFVIVSGIVAMISGFGLLLLTGAYPSFLVGVAAIGVGAGLYYSPSRAFLSDLFMKHRGRVFGIHTAVGMLGGAFAAGVAVLVLARATWQMAFLPPIVILVVSAILLVRWSRETTSLSEFRLADSDSIHRLLSNRGVIKILVGYIFFGFSFQAYIGFLPTLLQFEKGFSPALASGGFALIYITGVIVGPVAGSLGDYVKLIHVLIVAILVSMVGLTIMILGVSTPVLLTSIVLTATGLLGAVPVMEVYLFERFPDETAGGDFGLIKSFYTGLGSLGPTWVGLMAEQTSYVVAFSSLLVCLSISTAMITWASRSW